MTKVTLTNLADLQNETTAVNAINTNNGILQSAMDNTLSRDGTSPNQMNASLDMNNNQIINLPAPSTISSPARVQDVVTNPTIVLPGTGTSGHVVPYLDGNNTFSGNNIFSGSATYNGATTFNGTTTFASAIPNSGLATMANNTVKGNISGSTAQPSDVTIANLKTALAVVKSFSGLSNADILLNSSDLSMSGNTLQLSSSRKTTPTTQKFLTGSGTYTTPAGALWLRVRMVGGGGGGGQTAASAGGSSTFGTLTAGGGSGGTGSSLGGAGGTSSGGNVLNLSGGPGGCGGGALVSNIPGASGGNGYFGGAGTASNSVAVAPIANTGAGGSATTTLGTGGGAGGYVEHIYNSPAASYSYAVGSGGSAGSGGTAGAVGIIIVEEYYN